MKSKGLFGRPKRFLQLIFTTDFRAGGHKWHYRISEGEYDWLFSLSASSGDEFYDPYNPFAIYGYKFKTPDGRTRYYLELYAKGSDVPMFLSTEATNEDELAEYAEELARLAGLFAYKDPERFLDEIGEKGMFEITPEEELGEEYEDVRPNPEVARRILESITKRNKFVKVKSRVPPREEVKKEA